jgi:tellurite methyltransferase
MDKEYWNEYYGDDKAPEISSDFAIFIYCNYLSDGETKLDKEIRLIDIGCGNGRDSIFFHNNGIDVSALDQSDIVLDKLYNYNSDIRVLNKNAAMINDIGSFDVIYSRFSIHSMSYEEQSQFIYSSHDSLNDDGILCIEARTTNDELYGKGEKGDDPHSYITDHYRRFIEPNELISTLLSKYDILYVNVNNGLAVHGDEDPECIRIIAKKKAS